jgi:hypothetical protein
MDSNTEARRLIAVTKPDGELFGVFNLDIAQDMRVLNDGLRLYYQIIDNRSKPLNMMPFEVWEGR